MLFIVERATTDMKAIIFILILLLVATIEMIVLLYCAYKKLVNIQISGGTTMNERKYLAISIKHTEYKWKFGNECVLWGCRRSKDDEKRCFSGYTNDINCAEIYSVEEFINKYGSGICYSKPVKMCPNLCKKYKEYDTVLILESDYRTYYNMCKNGEE